mmetsp:Transcript_12462/g.10725  ORF Transcript_12462/g.10725 Transcript_12462/m.10725 type:complete len:107 (+) Transcript_12462:188-508(+)
MKDMKNIKFKRLLIFNLLKTVAHIHENFGCFESLGCIKPSNIFLDNDLNIYIDDYGTSKGNLGRSLGDGFCCPETLRQSEANQLSDSWSIGIMIVYILNNGALPDI